MNVAFLGSSGVCVIAAGLTFLETIANPYTTVLGPNALCGHPHQSGPILQRHRLDFRPDRRRHVLLFQGRRRARARAARRSTFLTSASPSSSLLLAVIFYFANVPDIKTEDDYHLDDKDAADDAPATADREVNRGLVYFLLLLNAAVLVCVCGMILWLILSAFDVGQHLVGVAAWIPHPSSMKITADNSLLVVICGGACLLVAVAALMLIPTARKISHHSIWSHPHFSAATLAQFFYVAAQAGIFSFFINYMTSEVPAIPAVLGSRACAAQVCWFETDKDGILHISDKGAANLASRGLYLLPGRADSPAPALLKKFSAHKILGLYGAAECGRLPAWSSASWAGCRWRASS